MEKGVWHRRGVVWMRKEKRIEEESLAEGMYFCEIESSVLSVKTYSYFGAGFSWFLLLSTLLSEAFPQPENKRLSRDGTR